MLDILNNDHNSHSPCLTCPHRDMDKNNCALLYLRLAAYNSGVPWQEKPLPYIAKGKNQTSPVKEEIVEMEETKETEVRGRKSEVGGQKGRRK